MADNATTHTFEADVSRVLHLVINSLYSNKEIFLRELVSNASDALDKLRFEAITQPELAPAGPLEIRISADPVARTLTIADNGIGMTRDELVQNLGRIAHSGTAKFAEMLKTAQTSHDAQLIGQFGVGFYSAWLVSDRVEVISRRAGHNDANRWVSDARETFTVESAERQSAGTTLVLHLQPEQSEYLEPWKLRSLVQRYSDYVSHPILLLDKGEPDEDAPDAPAENWQTINRASAIWRLAPSDVTAEQHQEFYKHLSHDWEAPLAHTHFRIEGSSLFWGLLYVPKRAPFDLFDRDRKAGVRLYVKRVLIMENCDELLPPWLRFLRGVVDSDDLPLNVSRELLQDSRLTRTIRKALVRKALELIEELARDRNDDYLTFWGEFGRVLKEGLHFDPEHAERLAKLARFESSNGSELTSLAQYVERMQPDQKAIYYAMGASRRSVESSPHLERLRRRNIEVLYMTDSIDQWAVQAMPTFDDKPLVSAMSADLDIEGEEQREEKKQRAEELKPLTDRFSDVLGERVGEVRLSDRLADSPVCLVVPKGGLHAHIERMLRAQDYDLPSQKRILEINASHPVIVNLERLSQSGGDERVNEWIEMLFDQALLSEGSPIDDPAKFAGRLTRLMTQATQA